MKQQASKPTPSVSEDVLQQLALELQRLAGNIIKDIKKKSTLKGLSNLTAITPIQKMLMNHLSETLFSNGEQEQQPETQNMSGYL